MFSDPRNGLRGQMLSSAYRIGAGQQCSGNVSKVELLSPADFPPGQDEPAFRILGHALSLPSRATVRKLVLTADGKIVGFAASVAGPFSAKHSELVRNAGSDDWLGYAGVSRNTASLDVYAVDSNAGALCHLAEVELPVVQPR